jgi:hypothetical protein
MGADPVATAVAAAATDEVPALLSAWDGAVDEVVLRALPVGDGAEEHLELVHAAAPSRRR